MYAAQQQRASSCDMSYRHGVAASVLLVLLACAKANDHREVQDECAIPGYVFKSGVRPAGASVTFLSAQPQPSTAAAVAACNADPTCTMFTTDGWLMGTKVYFTAAEEGKRHDLAAVFDPWLDPPFGVWGDGEHMELHWWTKPYCGQCQDAPGCCGSTNQGGPCCGTYVAAVSAAAGQLDLQQPLSQAPAAFHECEKCGSATNVEDACCLDRGSVQAVDAPCTGTGLTPIVASNIGYTSNVCGDYVASSTSKKFCSPRCGVRVLGAALNDDGSRDRQAGEGRAIRLDDSRCEAQNLQQVQDSGHPHCCELCWQSCCTAIKDHQEYYQVKFKITPRFEDMGLSRSSRDPDLDLPASGKCPSVEEASSQQPQQRGSCCQQLSYLRQYMPFIYTLASSKPRCSLDCAQRCGFTIEEVPADLEGLWCFYSGIFYGWSGFYPQWVKQGYLVKRMHIDTGAAVERDTTSTTAVERETTSTTAVDSTSSSTSAGSCATPDYVE